jgi:glutaredoxin 2
MGYTLYHYVHCPFCVRVRMALGYLNINYESKVLPYDDEQTPLKLIGKKMLPILTHDNVATNESLDIIMLVDKLNILKVSELIQTSAFKDLEKFLNRISGPVHSLAMPYWIFTPEFSESSRKYFQMKKEEKRGPFSELIKKQKDYISELTPLLNDLENNLRPFYKSNVFSLNDILIAAHLWGLYVVPEFQFSEKIHHYLQTIKHECRFNYHKDLWN